MKGRNDSFVPDPFALLSAAMLASIAALSLGFCPAAAAQPASGDLQQRLLAQAKSSRAEDFAFTRTVHSQSDFGEKKNEVVRVERFDPSKPAEDRWTLVSVDGAPPTEDAAKKYRSESAKRVVPGYWRLAAYFGTPAQTRTDSRGRTVFEFRKIPSGTVTVMDSDVSDDATIEATVGDAGGVPFVEEVRVTVKPTRIKLVMKIESYTAVGKYRMGPEGKPEILEQTSDMAGSGMGQSGHVHTVSTYSDIRLVGNSR